MDKLLKKLWGRVRILNNGELVAYKEPDWDYLLVKVDGCNRCGECCMDFPPTPFGCDDEGKCKMLVQRRGGGWKCQRFGQRPLPCVDDPVDREAIGCSITYRKVELG